MSISLEAPVADRSRALALKAKLLAGLADPSRLAILESLRDAPKGVGEVASNTGLSQPNASRHLACLHDCGLVIREQRGRFVYYRLGDARIEELLQLAEGVLRDVAKGVYECVDFAPSKRRRRR